MRNLRPTDGSGRYLNALLAHARLCQPKRSEPLFADLISAARAKYTALKAKVREVEDARERAVDLTAAVDAAEILLEREIRNGSDDLSKLERNQPELSIHAKVFPKGLGAVIDPARGRQVAPVIAFRERLSPFLPHPIVQELESRVAARLAGLEQALADKQDGDEDVKRLEAQELQLRGEAREQLTDAHARLTALYKANPALAAQYFHPDPREASSALSNAEARGRVAGKQDALLSFCESRGLVPSEEQQKQILEAIEEEALDRWLTRAYAGASLEEILAAPPALETAA
jgi:hypothetical protein